MAIFHELPMSVFAVILGTFIKNTTRAVIKIKESNVAGRSSNHDLLIACIEQVLEDVEKTRERILKLAENKNAMQDHDVMHGLYKQFERIAASSMLLSAQFAALVGVARNYDHQRGDTGGVATMKEVYDENGEVKFSEEKKREILSYYESRAEEIQQQYTDDAMDALGLMRVAEVFKNMKGPAH